LFYEYPSLFSSGIRNNGFCDIEGNNNTFFSGHIRSTPKLFPAQGINFIIYLFVPSPLSRSSPLPSSFFFPLSLQILSSAWKTPPSTVLLLRRQTETTPLVSSSSVG